MYLKIKFNWASCGFICNPAAYLSKEPILVRALALSGSFLRQIQGITHPSHKAVILSCLVTAHCLTVCAFLHTVSLWKSRRHASLCCSAPDVEYLGNVHKWQSQCPGSTGGCHAKTLQGFVSCCAQGPTLPGSLSYSCRTLSLGWASGSGNSALAWHAQSLGVPSPALR